MIPHIINDTSITFIARARPWTLAQDHQNFEMVRTMLVENTTDIERLLALTDIRENVSSVTHGRAKLSEDGVEFDGQKLDEAWSAKAMNDPDSLRVLVVKQGDRVRIEGDEDAKDGIYIVGAIDEKDPDQRIYVEDEDGVAFFGYVDNEVIKEILPPKSDTSNEQA